MKPLALYLPQFHTFPENDEWWGKGYTEWTAVRKAKPLFEGHRQPRIPQNENYYDLDNDGVKTLRWQADLAKKYGIYGFCFYQYWFNSKQLMEKPMETLRDNPDIDMNYCVCWANESWTRTWYGLQNEVLMAQEYGKKEDWIKHIDYLLTFFKDRRYIKIGNKPVLMIYRSYDIADLGRMKEVFEDRVRAAGFDGVYIISAKTAGEQDDRGELIDAYYYFEPGYSLKHGLKPWQTMKYNISVALRSLYNKCFKTTLLERMIPMEWIYSSIENRKYADNEIPGTLARWDNTPRRDHKGLVYMGSSPSRFRENLGRLQNIVDGRGSNGTNMTQSGSVPVKNEAVVNITQDKRMLTKTANEVDITIESLDINQQNNIAHEDGEVDIKELIIINAMNEWGEGAMLEPDEAEGYGYLEAVTEVIGC